MKTITVIAATQLELSALVKTFDAQPYPASLPWEIFVADVTSAKLLFVISGIGTSNASAATALAAQLFAPELIIATGCGGAYPESGLGIGDIALATSEFFADEGVVTPEGWQSLEQIGIPLLERNGRRYFNEIPLSPPAIAAALEVAGQLGITAFAAGRFLTVATCSGTNARGTDLTARFRGICENMEGAAVALMAARYGIECLELRGISNYVEDRDRRRWNINLAVANSQRFLEHFIRNQAA
ncbi:MAG: futalosine hydrolase [Deltaproteobacteria bacterium]|nr:futalosine hydrolase [Deltaproteobacteria bacterium]TLN03429.1 MAG: futalosine hydrolase [bacterium]